MDTKLNPKTNELRFSIIGAGKVASTLADKLNSIDKLDKIFVRSPQRINELEKFGLSSSKITFNLSEILVSNVVIIAISDYEIENLINQLVYQKIDFTNQIFFHTSGLKSAKVLQPLVEQGSMAFAAHPIQTFYSPNKSILKGVYWGIENLNALELYIKEIIHKLDGIPYFLSEKIIQNRELYHLMCVIASNFTTTTIEFAKLVANYIELEDLHILSTLIQTTIDNNIINLPNRDIPLTGPIARKDFSAIQSYWKLINNYSELNSLLSKYLEANLELMKLKQIYSSEEIDKVLNLLKNQ